MPDLRPGQLKRLGRISENNPERAEKVAERMDKRASRTERGAAIASNAEEKRTGGRDFAKGVAKVYETNYKEKQQAVRAGRDYPLSPTPEPINQMRGKINPSNGKVTVDGVNISDIKKPVNVVRGKINK